MPDAHLEELVEAALPALFRWYFYTQNDNPPPAEPVWVRVSADPLRVDVTWREAIMQEVADLHRDVAAADDIDWMSMSGTSGPLRLDLPPWCLRAADRQQMRAQARKTTLEGLKTIGQWWGRDSDK